MLKIKNAIISVSDKNGVVEFAKKLSELGVNILSTGGTAKALKSEGLKVTDISEYTGFPEMMDGRVKTLHPKVHGGILALRDNKEHIDSLNKHGMITIDMVVVNLYPFQKTVAKPDCSFEDAIENIDIGGPTMIRAAAKNFKYVVVVTDPSDYGKVLDELEENKDVSYETRLSFARKVFKTMSEYDGAIYNYLSKF
jgi:phosphoribosylaminoimidazolecarboxamide formyltransferase/IMP cyclohydrolase